MIMIMVTMIMMIATMIYNDYDDGTMIMIMVTMIMIIATMI